jgi:hypothetical protein
VGQNAHAILLSGDAARRRARRRIAVVGERTRESLGTDSRVLRLPEAVKTPAKAFGAKIFFAR